MRTGAIFARGSCRALKWMALVGVVFGLGAGSAAAQGFIATIEEASTDYSMKVVTVKVYEDTAADPLVPLPVWGTPGRDFDIGSSRNAMVSIEGVSSTSSGATNTFTVIFQADIDISSDVTLTYTGPSGPGEDETDATDTRLFVAQGKGDSADDIDGKDAIVAEDGTIIDVIAEAMNAPELPPSVPPIEMTVGTEYTAEEPAATLPVATENSGVGTVSYTLTGMPESLSDSFDPETRKFTGKAEEDDVGTYTLSYIATDERDEADGGPQPTGRSVMLKVMNPVAKPGKPQNLRADAGDAMVTLNWEEPPATGDDSGGPVESYEYDKNASGKWEDAGTGLMKTVTNLTNGTTYVFQVRAKNGAGTGMPTAGVSATPMAPAVDDPVTVKSVTSSTSVAEAGGLEVTVTANVPAGTKVGGKVAPIASKTVMVEIVRTGDTPGPGNDANNRSSIELLGDTNGSYTWQKIPRTDKASTAPYKFRVAIGQDLNAEDEKFKVKVTIDGAAKESKEVKIDDAQEQTFALSLPSSAKGKITEGADAVSLTLTAKPEKTFDIPVTLALNPNDPSKYTLSSTEGTVGTGSLSTTIAAKADKNRTEDTVTVSAYTSGTLGNDMKLAELEIPVTDINALPAVEAMLVDDKGEALDPQPESVMEGETVKVMLTAVDKDGKAMKAAENLTIMLAPTGTADSADYRLSPNSIEIAKDKESSVAADLMVTDNQDVGAETLTFDAVVAGEAKNGTEKKSVMGVLSLMIEDATVKQVYAKPPEEVEAAIYAAKNAGMGDDKMFTAGETIEIMGSAVFGAAEGVTPRYTAVSDNSGVASTSVSGGMVTVTAVAEGMAHITITADTDCPSGVKIVDQTDPCSVSVMFPVEVGLLALSLTLTGPEDMNLAEGMSAMVTVTANRAVTVDTTVNLMRDRAMSTAIDMDFEADPIVIKAGEMMGSTMVMAVEDNMAEEMEELVLYGMAADNAGEVTGEVKLYLWDAAVPALPLIAQLLLAAFLAVGGYRRYRRR